MKCVIVHLLFLLFGIKNINSVLTRPRSTQYLSIAYSSSIVECECGKPNHIPSSRIVGGTDISPHEYPWLAVLHYNGSFICGGSIINDLYVLTAAHCLSDSFNVELMKVKVGEHNMCIPNTSTTIFSVKKILIHPHYNKNNFTADIMLLGLNMRITFNKLVKPICLPIYSLNGHSGQRFQERYASVVGWGKTRYGAPKASCIPMILKVPILKKEVCGGKLAEGLFCAGYLDGKGDACQGDSGGPLQLKNFLNRYELIGVVSNGIGCALPDKPGLYTDVIRYLPWITKHTLDGRYCT